jgi:uncharacterized cupin superfamily protein
MAAAPTGIVNWDDVPAYPVEFAHLGATWRDLGRAAGTRTVGARRLEVAGDRFSTPVHVHTDEEEVFHVLGGGGAPAHCHSLEEEIFVVLDGSGTLRLYEQGPGEPTEYALRAGDTISRHAGTGIAHEIKPGDDGISYLAFSAREPNDMCFYPQLGTIALRGLGVSFSPSGLQWRPRPG